MVRVRGQAFLPFPVLPSTTALPKPTEGTLGSCLNHQSDFYGDEDFTSRRIFKSFFFYKQNNNLGMKSKISVSEAENIKILRR